MNSRSLLVTSLMLSLIVCEYPYIFGNSINTKGIANGLGDSGITGAQTTNWALDDVSQSVAYSNGTGESNSRAGGESLWNPQRHGANTGADAINTGEGNALADSVSKSFNPSKRYYNENYKQYIDFLNGLFKKYPHKRREIIKIVLKYADAIKHGDKAALNVDLDVAIRGKDKHHHGDHDNRNHDRNHYPTTNGYPTTLANFNDPDFQSIGQTTFDYQRARGSGFKTSASTNSGSYRWNDETVHKGNAVGNANKGWATSSSNDYGYGRVNYVNSEQNSGAYGSNAQTNSESNYYLRDGAVWNDGNAWGRADGKDSLAFSNLNGNSYGYGAVDGNTNSYTNGDLSVSKSEVKGVPYFPKY